MDVLAFLSSSFVLYFFKSCSDFLLNPTGPFETEPPHDPGPVPTFSDSGQFALNLILDTSVFNAISKADCTAAFNKSLEFCF